MTHTHDHSSHIVLSRLPEGEKRNDDGRHELAEEICELINDRLHSGEVDESAAILAVLMVVGDLVGFIECPDCRSAAARIAMEVLPKILNEVKLDRVA
jgi:hypothetical protein